MSETEEPSGIEEDTSSEIELTYDFMLSIKIYVEEEYNLNDNHDEIILEMIDYLHEMNISYEKIKIGLHLLYDTLDPTKKELIDSLCKPRSSTAFSTLFSTMVNNHIDHFTGDVINPANIINMFSANLNNIPHNQNFQITFDTTHYSTPLHLTFFSPLITSSMFFGDQHQLNTLNKSDLDENTTIISFDELSDDIKTKYNTCYICLADFNKEDTIRQIKCEHIFHKVCIDPWLLKENKTCPVCRK
jgi:hypothetical protein